MCAWGMKQASCSTAIRETEIPSWISDATVRFNGGGEVLLLLSSPAVPIRSGALRRSGRVYLDKAPATRHDDGRVERGERRRASVSDDVVVSNAKSHAPGIDAGVSHGTGSSRRSSGARVAGKRAATVDGPTDLGNVETTNRLLLFRFPLWQDTRHKGRAGW